MTRKLTKILATAAILGGLTTTAVFAEEKAPPSQPPAMHHGTGMTGDHGGMMGQMSPDQMEQMSRMVNNCNRMMESMGGPSTGPDNNPTTG